MSDVIFLSNARISFPHIAEPQRTKQESGAERISYNCALILPPTSPDFAKFMAAVNAMALIKWADLAPQVLQMIHGDRKKRCFSKGDEHISNKTMKMYDGYEGNVVISAGRDSMPQIIDPDGKPIDPTNTMACQALARKMYAGSRVNAAVKPWLQDNKYGRAVRCDLVALQFLKDDVAFGDGAPDASGLFTPVAAPADAPWATPAAPGMPAAPFPGATLPSFM